MYSDKAKMQVLESSVLSVINVHTAIFVLLRYITPGLILGLLFGPKDYRRAATYMTRSV